MPKGTSKDQPWVLSDSDSEPDLALDIHSIKRNNSNTRTNLNKNNDASSSSSSTSTLASRTNSQLRKPGLIPNSSSPSSSTKTNRDKKSNSNSRSSSRSDDSIEFTGTGRSNSNNPAMNSNQSQAIDTSGFARLSTFKSFIVGVSYYPSGSAAAGEAITFTRQPQNQYDPNAVEVRARGTSLLGHLGRDEARKFAPLMDENKIVLEGYMLDRCSGGSEKPRIVMDIKGKPSEKSSLEGALRFTTPSWSGFGDLTASQPNAKQVMEGAPAVKAAVVQAARQQELAAQNAAARERVRVKNEPAAAPPAPQAPAVVPPPVVAEPHNIVVATYHCNLTSSNYLRLEVPAGSPLKVERNALYGNILRVKNQQDDLAGLIPTDAALKLIPLLDQQKIQLEAFSKAGLKSSDRHRGLQAVMDIKCRASEYETLKPQLEHFINLSNSVGTGNIRAATLAASFARYRSGAAAAPATQAGPSQNPAIGALFNAADMLAGAADPFAEMMNRSAGGHPPGWVDPDADLQEEEEERPEAGPALGAELQDILGQMQAGTYRGTDALTSLYGEEGSVELAELPLHPNPEHWIKRGVTTELRSHQSQGVAWMQRSEHREAPTVAGVKQNCLWHARKKRGGGVFWRNIASNPDLGFELKSRHAPVLMKGGILADSMGLGKTLSIIALALSDPRARDIKAEDKKKAEEKENSEKEKDSQGEGKENQDQKKDIKSKGNETPRKKSSFSAPSTSQDIKSTPKSLKSNFQELKKSSLASRTPSGSSSSGGNGSAVKKRGLILPSPPRKVVPDSDEDSHTEEEEDVKPKINKKTAKMEVEGESEEDVKPDISKKGKKKAPRVESDSEEDVKPKVKASCKSKAKLIDSNSDFEDVKPKVKSNSKGKGRKLNSHSEEDVKPKIKKSVSSVKKKASKKKKVEVESEVEGDDMDEDEEEDGWTESNLIVCPLSVLHNWETQITEHTDNSMVNYVVFHGKSITSLRYSDLSKYKFVLTTYDQIKTEHKLTEAKNALKTEQNRPDYVMEDLEADLENANERLEDASSRGERQAAEEGKEQAERAISVERKLRQSNVASQAPKKKGSKKKKVEAESEAEDTDDLWSDEDGDYRDKKSKQKKTDKERVNEIKESALFTTKWRRVVLDEAHTIRNAKTAVFRAARDIQADRRWCASGTPIVNKTLDLGSLCQFLGLEPFTDPKLWNKLVELPIKKKRNIGYNLLKNVVSTAVLRRTKNMTTEDGTRIIDFPPLEKYHHTIPLDPETRAFYEEVELSVQNRVTGWVEGDELHRHAGIMLVFLMRLRQICNDRSLLPANFLDDVRNRDFDAPIQDAGSKLTADQIANLQDKLRAILDVGEDCPVCMEALQGKDPRITTCSHVFCKACIEEVIKTNAKCPMDRNAITMGSLVELPAEVVKDDPDQDDEPEQAPEDRSAKANTLIDVLNAIYASAPQRKSLIFSSYTSYLDKLAVRLRKEGVAICRFDGRMNKPRRDAVLESFKRPLPAVGPSAPAPAPSASTPKTSSGSSLLDALRKEEDKFQNQPASKRKTAPIPRGHVRAEKERIQRDLDGAGAEIPRVMLISMGAGSVGLNLTAASNVFLMDPHWNTALEDQAIDRAHRIGQEQVVKVFHIIAENTVEQRVLEIQASKENLVLEAFKGVKNRGAAIEQERVRNETQGAGRTRLEDLVTLFGLNPDILRRRHNSNNFIRN